MKVVLITGGFDPLHSGHIAYIKSASSIGSLLVVGVNSDAWLERKKGRSFMPFSERFEIIKNLEQVHRVIEFNDDDNPEIILSEKEILDLYFPHWLSMMAKAGKTLPHNAEQVCIDDWVVVNWAQEVER